MALGTPSPQVAFRGSSYAQVVWPSVPGATYYQLARYDPQSHRILSPSGSIGGTSYLVSNISPYGRTYVVVRSGNAQELSNWSQPIAI
jgi:hypothetical protein